ncbi:hypothetical protein BVY11_09320 [Pseudomonas amygdali pv. morsprunorum]|nr:hypothetical protein BVY11_09320 [Pseudomonas amygdali pv. morsprunorum]
MRDAPRHRSLPHCTLKRGRRASRTACDAELRKLQRFSTRNPILGKCTCTTPARLSSRRRINSSRPVKINSPSTASTP